MTLIVSNISQHGIVMLADSAETYSVAGDTHYVRTGVRKIVPVRDINAGISMWGRGEVNGFPMDLWVENFVRDNVTPDWTLRRLCDALAGALNTEGIFPGPDGNAVGGFHVAAYEDNGAGMLPGLYHVHNKHPHEVPHELRVYHDWPCGFFTDDFARYRTDLEAGHVDWHIRNGNFRPFIMIWDALHGDPRSHASTSVLARLSQEGIRCPFPDTLPERARFYAFLVEIVARPFSMSNSVETISMPLSLLTIDGNGIREYQPALRREASSMVF